MLWGRNGFNIPHFLVYFKSYCKQPGRNYGETLTVFSSLFLRLDLHLELPSGQTSSLASSVASTHQVTHPLLSLWIPRNRTHTSSLAVPLVHIKWYWNMCILYVWEMAFKHLLFGTVAVVGNDKFSQWTKCLISHTILKKKKEQLETFLHCQSVCSR